MIALTVRVAAEAAETVLAELVALVPGGMEERPASGGVDYVLYGTRDALPSRAQLEAAAGPALIAVAEEEVADDWSERWKAWHRAVDVAAGGRRIRVRPPWEPALGSDGIDLVIDPGQAFGTGGHDTTRLCLGLLLEQPPAGGLADWGCGSGVLALAAARLGHAPVVAVDHDPAALRATRDNAAANGIEGLEVARVDLTTDPGPRAPVVVANLVRPLLLDVARLLREPPPVLIASGLLRDEVDEVARAFGRHNLRETARRRSGDWAAVRLENG